MIGSFGVDVAQISFSFGDMAVASFPLDVMEPSCCGEHEHSEQFPAGLVPLDPDDSVGMARVVKIDWRRCPCLVLR